MTRSTRTAAAVGVALVAATLTAPPAHAALPTPTPGWSVVVMGPSTTTTGRQLVLVSPGGLQYPMGKIGADWTLNDVSPDARRVLVRAWSAPADMPEAGVDVHSFIDVNAARQFSISREGGAFRLDRGDARYLVSERNEGDTVVRETLARRVVRDYQRPANYLQSPNGTRLALFTDTITVVDTATGARVKSLDRPSSAYRMCWPGHWTSSTTFTASCALTASPARRVVFKYSTSGAAPVALTTATQAASLPTWTVMDAHVTAGGGTVVRIEGNNVCAVRHAKVSGSQLVPQTLPTGGRAVGMIGNWMYSTDQVGCGQGTGTFFRRDAVSGKTVLMAGGTRNPGLKIYSVYVIDPSR